MKQPENNTLGPAVSPDRLPLTAALLMMAVVGLGGLGTWAILSLLS